MKSKGKILIANGVNLDLLGQREPSIYGSLTLAEINALIQNEWHTIQQSHGKIAVELEFFQSNDECAYLEKITGPWVGILLNPGAWTHTSLALADRLSAVSCPVIEVHLSHTLAREPIRQQSLTAPYVKGVVSGLKEASYLAALRGLYHLLQATK